MIAEVGISLAILVVVIALAASVWLSYSALSQLRQLRHELDQSQQQGNQTRVALDQVRQDLNQALRELSDLKAAAEVVPPPPPRLPRARSSGLDDLREQLRAAHSEEEPPSEE